MISGTQCGCSCPYLVYSLLFPDATLQYYHATLPAMAYLAPIFLPKTLSEIVVPPPQCMFLKPLGWLRHEHLNGGIARHGRLYSKG